MLRFSVKIITRLSRVVTSPEFWLMFGILVLAIFLRGFRGLERFEYGHDADLYAWVVRDIVIDGHTRLIGQLTSTPGIFIGSLFYYLLIPFFIFNGMNITALYLFGVLIGVATVISFYFVFKKLYGSVFGIIAAMLQATLLSRITWDRWVVPTISSHLWEVWYFYTLINLARANFSAFLWLGILAGLIWHINFTLAPILLAVPLAVLVSRKKPPVKEIVKGVIAGFVTSLPLFVFELRHNFQQTQSLLMQFKLDQGGGTGWDKLIHVVAQISGNITQLLFYPERYNLNFGLVVCGLLLLLGLFLIISKKLALKEGGVLLVWLLSMIGYFSFSSKIISEYYFANLEMVFLVAIILGLGFLYKTHLVGRLLVGGLLIMIAINSIYFLTVKDVAYQSEYLYRSQIISTIKNDAILKNYPCVAISYITDPGRNLGYRYMTYLADLKLRPVNSGVPVYSIVMPKSLVFDSELLKTPGPIGIILPKEAVDLSELAIKCEGDDINLTDSMFGFTK